MREIQILDLGIKGGHKIHVRTQIEYAAWCAYCKEYVPPTTEELIWKDTGELDAINRLGRHIALAHASADSG